MKRWIAAFLLLCMLAGLLSACSPSGGDERTEPLTKDVSPQSYTETKDGVTLRVTVQNPVCRPGDTVEVEAVVTNASDETIEYCCRCQRRSCIWRSGRKLGTTLLNFLILMCMASQGIPRSVTAALHPALPTPRR